MGSLRNIPISMWLYIAGNTLLIFIGVVLVKTGFSEALGTALLASGIVGLIYFAYLRAEKGYEIARDIYENWGLLGVYPNREDKDLYGSLLKECKKRLDIQATTLSRFYTDFHEQLIELGKKGVKMQFLLLDPDSDQCKHREDEVKGYAEYTGLPEKIKKSTQLLRDLNIDDLKIRYYSHPPSNYFRIDDKVFVGPYLLDVSSRNTVTLLAEINKPLANQYRHHFEKLWEQSKEV